MHNVILWDYSINCNKREVQAECDHYAAMEDWQEGCSGVEPIRWLENEVCLTRDDAEKRIDELDKGWYDCLAVKYRVPKTSKTLKNAKQRSRQANQALTELKSKLEDELKNAKSAMIGCKSCKSSIARKYLKTTRCPVCHAELLSPTALGRIESAKARLDKALGAVIEAEKANSKKSSEMRWLVKFEYHT